MFQSLQTMTRWEKECFAFAEVLGIGLVWKYIVQELNRSDLHKSTVKEDRENNGLPTSVLFHCTVKKIQGHKTVVFSAN